MLAPSAWPDVWQVLELNPGHVTEQRKVMGRRSIKTDAVDLEAMTELLPASSFSTLNHRARLGSDLAQRTTPPGSAIRVAGPEPSSSTARRA